MRAYQRTLAAELAAAMEQAVRKLCPDPDNDLVAALRRDLLASETDNRPTALGQPDEVAALGASVRLEEAMRRRGSERGRSGGNLNADH